MWVRGSPPVGVSPIPTLWPTNTSQASPWVGPNAGGIGGLNLQRANIRLGWKGLCPSCGIPKRNLAVVDFHLTGRL